MPMWNCSGYGVLLTDLREKAGYDAISKDRTASGG